MPGLWHGSADPLDEGTLLVPRPGGYVTLADPGLEALFERARPQGMSPRGSAVFMVENPDLVDAAGGYADHLYEVEPTGPASRHDLAWYSEAQERMDAGEMAEAELCARAYWAGVAHPVEAHSLFETISPGARVLPFPSSRPGA